MSSFDFDATFGDDYLHFYLPMLDEARNREDAGVIVESLGLVSGNRVLDAGFSDVTITDVEGRTLTLESRRLLAIAAR